MWKPQCIARIKFHARRTVWCERLIKPRWALKCWQWQKNKTKTKHINTFSGLLLSLYVSIGKNNSSSCHTQQGVFVGRSPGVGFGLPQPPPSERCFLCCYPARNPIFLHRLLMGDLWMLIKSMDQEELYGDLDVEILLLSSRRVIFILCTCTLAEQRFPGRFTTSQSLSTCRVCSWQEFSGILEFLEGIWKNFQTDRRQRQHPGDVARSHLIVTCNSSLAYVSTQSVWPSDAL